MILPMLISGINLPETQTIGLTPVQISAVGFPLRQAMELLNASAGILQLLTLFAVFAITFILIRKMRRIQEDAAQINQQLNSTVIKLQTRISEVNAKPCSVKNPPPDCQVLLNRLDEIKQRLTKKYPMPEEKE